MNQNDWGRFIGVTAMIVENYHPKEPFSEAKQNLWWQLLYEFEIVDLENALIAHMRESSFTPKPADLIKRMEPDYQEIFNRCLRRGGYKNSIEQITWGAVGFACRTQLSEKDALAKFIKEYKRQVKLSKQDRTDMSHQLEDKEAEPKPEAPVRPTDKIIDENMGRYKAKGERDLDKMFAELRNKTKLNKRN